MHCITEKVLPLSWLSSLVGYLSVSPPATLVMGTPLVPNRAKVAWCIAKFPLFFSILAIGGQLELAPPAGPPPSSSPSSQPRLYHHQISTLEPDGSNERGASTWYHPVQESLTGLSPFIQGCRQASRSASLNPSIQDPLLWCVSAF